jgi:transposase
LCKSQIQAYTKHVGDCRKTWNILTSKQDTLGNSPKQEELRVGLINKTPTNLKYLRKTPKDCRDFVLEEFCNSVKNMHTQYDKKIKSENARKEWCKTNYRKYTERVVKKPIINFRTKKQDQVLTIPKSAVTLFSTGIKIYPQYYGKEPIRLNDRVIKKSKRKKYDKQYEQILQDGLKHDIKLIKTKSNKFYFAIPYDVTKQNILKKKEFGSGDPGVKTFLTTSDSTGTCIAYGDSCDIKIRKIHAKIDVLKNMLSAYKHLKINHKVKELRVKINTLEEHLKNKVRDLHYNVIKELKVFKRFYLPQFQNKQMERLKTTRRNTKREMNCLSHYQFSQRLKTKAEEIGSKVYVSDEYRTTMVCTSCIRKNIVGFSREFNCRHCGFKWFRDANASRNNVLKYLI